jgi:hypothetical protein
MFNKSVVPLVIVFMIAAGLILVFRASLERYGFNWQVLSGGNLFVYLVTVISMNLLRESLNAGNTHAFLTKAYTGILIKLFACAIAAFVYIFAAGKNLNKPSLFACMGLYLVYTFVELSVILKHSNQKKNAQN